MTDADFIIVGGGTAGSVLAGRLSADGRNRTLLIEAGGKPDSSFVSIPAGFARLFQGKLDWAFQSTPQTHAQRRIFTPRGKMLGGSSNMNAQIHQWCHPEDFEEWRAAGARGWSFADVAPVFIRQENWRGDSNNVARGAEGPMLAEPNHNAHALSHEFVSAARAIGLDGPADYNGGAFEGAWIVQIAHKDGKRFSAYDAYLKPAIASGAVQAVTHAHVAGLIFEGRRCVGVKASVGGQMRAYKAARGVILAAGAYGSPQLLQLSGVGPAALLREHGVAVLSDIPGVGAGLQDHPTVALNFATSRRDTLKSAESLPNLLRYMLFRRGPLASNAIEAFAFARVGAGEPAPNLELMFAPLEWRNQGLDKPSVHAFTIAPAVVRAHSRGSVKIASNNPFAAPLIDPNLLSDPDGRDRRILLEGMRMARRIAASAPLAAAITHEMAPHATIDSDDALLDFAARNLQTVYHPTSTCRMGEDDLAVVDPELKLRGFESVWVADASVMPHVPRGHPNAVVAMIANRAADLLLRAH
jgi:choline dehydrogenase